MNKNNTNGSLASAATTPTTPPVPTTATFFDHALWRYDAVTDTPCALFAPELLLAYPHAKVILTHRSPSSWVASMQRSYYAVLQSRSAKLMCLLDGEFSRKYHAMGMGTLRAWTGGDVEDLGKLREGYVAHYERMRALVPKERLLEWHPSDGWGPLCEFLGKEVPEGEFPRVNQGDWVAELHVKMLIFRFLVVVGKALRMVSPLVMVGVAWWWFLR
jgi:hypothetical protein